MEAQYAPDGLSLGDEITGKGHQRPAEVIAIGLAVVVVRDKAGYTRTLLRKREEPRKRKKKAA